MFYAAQLPHSSAAPSGSVMEAMATILHADLDAFYASVEQMLDPSLRGKPVAVGGGVVLAASYEAKAFGVRGGMPGRKARELCPQLTFVSGHFKDYQQLGDAAIRVLGDFTPLVERTSIGQLAETSPRSLDRLLGRAASDKLGALAWNRDPREIKTHRRAQSAGAQSAIGKKAAAERVFRPGLRHLADRIGSRLRAKSRL